MIRTLLLTFIPLFVAVDVVAVVILLLAAIGVTFVRRGVMAALPAP
jgi:hypothetical protein